MEIFTRTATSLAGVFSADTATLSFSDGVPTALVQNLQASYMQAVTRLFEIGNVNGRANVYYVGGRSQGSLNIGRVIGPSVLMSSYYSKFGNICNARTNNLRFGLSQIDCSATPAVNGRLGVVAPVTNAPSVYLCKFCVITTIGISIAAQDMIINESSSLMFSGMEYTGP